MYFLQIYTSYYHSHTTINVYSASDNILSDAIQFISANNACISTFIDQHLCTIL